jgi:hypothetical protein
MVSTAGGIVIAIVVILVVAAAGWVVFTQLRARRLGVSFSLLCGYLCVSSPYYRIANTWTGRNDMVVGSCGGAIVIREQRFSMSDRVMKLTRLN